jgi:ATP-dependent Lon protease
MVDEIDKAGDIRVENALLQIFEPETAARWIDQYVEVPIDLSRILLVATANDETQLSPILLSRFEVFDIQKPEDTALAAVFNSIYADEKQQFRTTALFSEHLSGAVIDKLIQSSMTPREARRLLLNAMELAIIRTHGKHGQLQQGSVVVQPDDMPLPRRVEHTSRIGFI